MGCWHVRLLSETSPWYFSIHRRLALECLGDGGAGMETPMIVSLILLHRCPFLQQRTKPTF